MAKRLFATVATAALLAGCSGGANPDEVVETVRLTEQSQLQAIDADEVVGIVRLYADDARLVRPDGTVLQGGAAIGEEYAHLIEDPNFAITIEPTDGWASANDDLAVLTSQVTFTTSDPETGEPVTLPMTSQTVWTKDPGGSWMIRSAYNVAQVAEEAPAEATEAAE
jgi:ketosteroid isomerase-like protein